jgi:hypothetical protein
MMRQSQLERLPFLTLSTCGLKNRVSTRYSSESGKFLTCHHVHLSNRREVMNMAWQVMHASGAALTAVSSQQDEHIKAT